MLITILATIVVLGVLILVHELGHFWAAKSMDIEVPRFSIGLGPKMVGFTRGETEYVISWLPLGGYVKMAGMEEMEAIEGGAKPKNTVSGAGTAVDLGVEVEDPRQAGPRDFESKSIAARTLVISAGVIMNLIFAFLVFSLMAFVWGTRVSPITRIGGISEELLPQGTEQLATLPAGTRITAVGRTSVENFTDLQIAITKVAPGDLEFRFDSHAPITVAVPAGDSARASLVAAFEPALSIPPVLGTVVANSPADRAGLEPGDRIDSANGQKVTNWQQMVSIVESNAGKPVRLVVERDGSPVNVTVTPDQKTLGSKHTYGRVGVSPQSSLADAFPRQRASFLGAFANGAERTWEVVAMTVGFLKDLVTGGASPRNLGGPILIGKLSGQVARAGLEQFLGFMALFSVNLAVLNLLPIPVLDGGHLVFLGWEAIRGKPLSLENRMRLSQVGFFIVIAIMVWALSNDVLRLFGI
jgi:regulator of sigma E protease